MKITENLGKSDVACDFQPNPLVLGPRSTPTKPAWRFPWNPSTHFFGIDHHSPKMTLDFHRSRFWTSLPVFSFFEATSPAPLTQKGATDNVYLDSQVVEPNPGEKCRSYGNGPMRTPMGPLAPFLKLWCPLGPIKWQESTPGHWEITGGSVGDHWGITGSFEGANPTWPLGDHWGITGGSLQDHW